MRFKITSTYARALQRKKMVEHLSGVVSVTPRDRCSRRLPYVPGFAACFICARPFIFALHHVVMSSSHKSFASHLNKLCGSSIHLIRGSSHGEILFIIYKSLLRLLGSYIKNSIVLKSPKTHLQVIPQAFVISHIDLKRCP